MQYCDMKETVISTAVCQEDHTACYQINAGHMEDRGSDTTIKNKQGGVYQYYDKLMTGSVTTASNNKLDRITDSKCV